MSLRTLLLVMAATACATALSAVTPAPAPVTPPPTPSPTPFPLPVPAWSSCPAQFSSIFTSCADVIVPNHWVSPTNHDNQTFFLGRLAPNGAITPNTTVWYLGDDCVVSGLSQWVSQMLNKNFYVVGVYPRGSPYGSSPLACSAADTDPTTGWPLPSCGVSLSQANIDVSMYSVTEMAHDLKFVIPTLGSTVNVVFADGFMTTVAQRLQLIDGGIVSAFVLAGFTDPTTYDAVQSPLDAYESVMRRVLAACMNDDIQCAGYFGGQDVWQVWTRTLDAAAAGTLTCATKLKWAGVTSYRNAIANVAALLVSTSIDPFTTPSAVATPAFLPALIYRLQRCSDDDVTALTFLRNTLLAAASVVPPSALCVYTMVQFNMIINELMPTVPSNTTVLSFIADRLVQPLPTYYTALAEVAEQWPRYTVPATDKTLGGPQPMALLSGDADVFTPLEVAKFAVYSSYGAATDSFQSIARGQHPLLSTIAKQCIASVLGEIASTRTAASVPACGASGVPAYDFMGTATGDAVMQYWGTSALWAFTVPTPPVTPLPPATNVPTSAPTPNTPSPGGQPPGPPEESSTDKKAVIALAILLTFTWVGGIAYIVIRRRGGAPTLFQKDRDFYSAVNEK